MSKQRVWKKNNKGSSMVMVVAALGLISILTAVVLSTSLMNFHMKLAEQKSKENFYSAEGALEEIRAGIQKNAVSTALQHVYTLMMQDYADFGSEQMKQKCRDTYQMDLLGVYEDSAIPGRYNVAVLSSYLDKSVVRDDSGNYLYGATLEATTNPALATSDRGVTLKNLVVEFFDKEGNLSVIQTDLLLAYPEFNFAYQTSLPNLSEHVLVANERLVADGTTDAKIYGSMYGGKDEMHLSNGATVTVSEADMVVANRIRIEKKATFNIPEETTNLWARDINLTSGNVNLFGITHVANDLNVKSIRDVPNYVCLKNQYLGFGNAKTAQYSAYIQDQVSKGAITLNDADFSSSIVINGADTTMDLSGLSYLLLAGNAYISAPKNSVGRAVDPGVDIRTGESLSVKSNQLAYLVPPDAIGVGMDHGGTNPMTGKTYEALKKDYENDQTKNFERDLVNWEKKLPQLGGKSLNDLNVSGTAIKTVFFPEGGTTTAYVFLDFPDEETADAYFRAYYGVKENRERLNKYLKMYADQIQIDKDSVSSFNLKGNLMFLDSADAQPGYYPDTIAEDAVNEAYYTNRQAGQQDMFGALHTKLVTQYGKLTGEEKQRDVFGNLVETGKISGVFGVNEQRTFTTTDGRYHGLVVNNQGEGAAPLVIDSAKISEGGGRLCLVIVSGDVVLDNCDFQGMILAGGTVTLKGQVNVAKNESACLQVLQAENSGIKLYEYLRDGYLYAASNVVSGAQNMEDYFYLTDLIVYENWKKR